MRSKEYYKLLILSHAEEIKESIYIIFSPIFSAYLSYSGRHIKLLPFQGARRGDMNTQGECPGLGASAPSGREGNSRDVRGMAGGVRGMAGMREGNGV